MANSSIINSIEQLLYCFFALIHWLMGLLVDWLVGWLIDWLIEWSIDTYSQVAPLTSMTVCLFCCRFMQILVSSFPSSESIEATLEDNEIVVREAKKPQKSDNNRSAVETVAGHSECFFPHLTYSSFIGFSFTLSFSTNIWNVHSLVGWINRWLIDFFIAIIIISSN